MSVFSPEENSRCGIFLAEKKNLSPPTSTCARRKLRVQWASWLPRRPSSWHPCSSQLGWHSVTQWVYFVTLLLDNPELAMRAEIPLCSGANQFWDRNRNISNQTKIEAITTIYIFSQCCFLTHHFLFWIFLAHKISHWNSRHLNLVLLHKPTYFRMWANHLTILSFSFLIFKLKKKVYLTCVSSLSQWLLSRTEMFFKNHKTLLECHGDIFISVFNLLWYDLYFQRWLRQTINTTAL